VLKVYRRSFIDSIFKEEFEIERDSIWGLLCNKEARRMSKPSA
jgi:hypothetical protein